MNRVRLASMASIFSTVAWLSLADRTDASEWGCEVLLCASSSNPAWRGVPACHPPMYRLISAMSKRGFSWPTCPEAGTGRPGYDAYEECPAGWSIGSIDTDRGHRKAPNLCIRVTATCGKGYIGRGRECRRTVAMVRPLRESPYYFDIPSKDGKTERHWFGLRK